MSSSGNNNSNSSTDNWGRMMMGMMMMQPQPSSTPPQPQEPQQEQQRTLSSSTNKNNNTTIRTTSVDPNDDDGVVDSNGQHHRGSYQRHQRPRNTRQRSKANSNMNGGVDENGDLQRPLLFQRQQQQQSQQQQQRRDGGTTTTNDDDMFLADIEGRSVATTMTGTSGGGAYDDGYYHDDLSPGSSRESSPTPRTMDGCNGGTGASNGSSGSGSGSGSGSSIGKMVFNSSCGEFVGASNGNNKDTTVPNKQNNDTANSDKTKSKSTGSNNTDAGTSGDPLRVIGLDLSHWDSRIQFAFLAGSFFGFSLWYGYLQELIQVELSSRHLGLFLATAQFAGYTTLAYVFNNWVYEKRVLEQTNDDIITGSSSDEENQQGQPPNNKELMNDDSMGVSVSSKVTKQWKQKQRRDSSTALRKNKKNVATKASSSPLSTIVTSAEVPVMLYLGLSLLRAIDLSMTNLAMQYINYPAKTLMKSSRVVFVMLFSVVINGKRYAAKDYLIVFAMVIGLSAFMHADFKSTEAVFHPMGIIMLSISLICDATVSNMSEIIMNKFRIGQDEFILRLYSIAMIAIGSAAALKDDLTQGLLWLSQPGTYQQILEDVPYEERTHTASYKLICLLLFSSTGFFASSTSTAMVKHFGALSMSITSTARKATTLFLSFILFNNVCTTEHMIGMFIFIAALTIKSFKQSQKSKGNKKTSSSSSGAGINTSSSASNQQLPPPMLPKPVRIARLDSIHSVGEFRSLDDMDTSTNSMYSLSRSRGRSGSSASIDEYTTTGVGLGDDTETDDLLDDDEDEEDIRHFTDREIDVILNSGSGGDAAGDEYQLSTSAASLSMSTAAAAAIVRNNEARANMSSSSTTATTKSSTTKSSMFGSFLR